MSRAPSWLWAVGGLGLLFAFTRDDDAVAAKRPTGTRPPPVPPVAVPPIVIPPIVIPPIPGPAPPPSGHPTPTDVGLPPIDLKTTRRGKPAPYMIGPSDTPQSLATHYTGDATRWVELGAQNGHLGPGLVAWAAGIPIMLPGAWNGLITPPPNQNASNAVINV